MWKDFIKNVAVFAFTLIVVLPLMTLWQGWAVSTVWNWFVAPLGVATISTAIGAGLSLVAMSMRPMLRKGPVTEKEKVEYWTKVALFPPMIVAVGWVIKTFG